MKEPEQTSHRESFKSIMRYWETKRIIYNIVLAILTIGLSYREFIEVIGQPILQTVGLLIVLGIFFLVANVCYCAAYVADIAVQLTPLSQPWQRFRWMLFTTGTLLACVCVVVVLYAPDTM